MVAFNDMWRGHPINESVQYPCIAPRDLTNMEGTRVRAGVPVFHNQCSIRLGVALKRAGVKPISGLVTCGVHSPSEMHYVRATDRAQALTRGSIPGVQRVERSVGRDLTRDVFPKLYGRTGLIYLQDYWQRSVDRPGNPTGDHIDVWNGYRSSAKWLMEWFSWLGYYSNYAGAKEVWFWPVR
ncbi:MAG: T6SS effector amidase Tae4 family protein [Hyphomicrobiaceae bacterium]